MWKTFGGAGYAHILRAVRDMVIDCGVSPEKYDSILTDNVRNFIA
jgi:hypothetical protein